MYENRVSQKRFYFYDPKISLNGQQAGSKLENLYFNRGHQLYETIPFFMKCIDTEMNNVKNSLFGVESIWEMRWELPILNRVHDYRKT